MSYSLLRPLLFQLPPELAHNLAIKALKYGFVAGQKSEEQPALKQTICGIEFRNPVSIAAGFDKNAEAIRGLAKQGFGYLELGTVTPKPQPGNPKPRMFRLESDEAVINRLGFNNKGLDVFCRNLKNAPRTIPLGANIGKNKDTEKAVDDYLHALEAVYPHCDYITVNISSPNTAGLRDLQGKHHLEQLLSALAQARDSHAQTHGSRKPLWLKIAPDLEPADREAIASVALEQQIDALIVSNTTIDRPLNLQSSHRKEKGGLSGKPLFKPSTQVLADMYRLTNGGMPIIGVGGISSGADAYSKIRNGASLVQLYSALVYQGFGLVNEINHDLAALLAKDGFNSISDAIGIDVK